MALKMIYESDYHDKAPYKIEINVDKEANLAQHFIAFVELTRMAGFQAGSWEYLIDEIYGYCILHVDAPEDYDIFQWASDGADVR